MTKQLQQQISLTQLKQITLTIPTITVTPTIITPTVPVIMPPYISDTPPPPPIQPPPPKFGLFGLPLPDDIFDKMFGQRGQGYNVEVRERHYVKGKKVKEGEFITLSKRPLSRMDALNLGGAAVDRSAAATFRIKPVDAMAQKPLIKLPSFENIQHKFYMKENKDIIERKTYRIDTKGEEQQISALGWHSEKTRAAKKRQVVARRPRERVIKEPVDMDFDFIGDFNKNMKKMFKM